VQVWPSSITLPKCSNISYHLTSTSTILIKTAFCVSCVLRRLPAGQFASVVPVHGVRWTVEFLHQETRDFISLDLWPPINLHITHISTRLGAACRSIQEASTVRDMAQLKQRLVEVRADFKQTAVNKAIDQWSKQAFVRAKGRHFEHSLFIISRLCLDR